MGCQQICLVTHNCVASNKLAYNSTYKGWHFDAGGAGRALKAWSYTNIYKLMGVSFKVELLDIIVSSASSSTSRIYPYNYHGPKSHSKFLQLCLFTPTSNHNFKNTSSFMYIALRVISIHNDVGMLIDQPNCMYRAQHPRINLQLQVQTRVAFQCRGCGQAPPSKVGPTYTYIS